MDLLKWTRISVKEVSFMAIKAKAGRPRRLALLGGKAMDCSSSRIAIWWLKDIQQKTTLYG
jgi:hypothetical protein